MHTKIRSQKHYTDRIFQELCLEDAAIAGSEFHGCVFANCSLVESILQQCRFVDCTFRDCDASLMQVPDTVFASVQFEDAKVMGVDWAQADWKAIRLGKPLAFSHCNISHSTFMGLALEDIEIKDCLALNVDFRRTDLSGANMRGTDLSETLFSHTNLTEADLRGAQNYRIDPSQNTLTGAKFSLPEALALLYSLDITLTEEDAR